VDSEDVIEIIDELGRRIEGPAKHVFELAIRQVYVEAVSALLFWLVLSVLMAAAARYYFRLYKRGDDVIDGPMLVFMGTIFGGVAWLVSTVFVLATVPALLNPEWRAIEMIAGSLLP
jgi:hypothetical protein